MSQPEQTLSGAEGDRATKPNGIAAALVGQVVGFLVGSLIVAGLFYDEKAKNKIQPGLLPVLAQFPFLWMGLLISVLVVARRRGETVGALTAFRIVPRDILYAAVGVALQYGGGAIYVFFDKNDEAGQSAKELIDNARNDALGFFVLAALVAFGAPLVEELLYRGLVARGFERLFSKKVSPGSSVITPARLAIGVSALWFAAIHLQPLQFPLLFVVGAVCAWLTLDRKRLGPAIFVHMGFNLTTVIALGLELVKK